MKKYILYGNGGHAKVITDLIKRTRGKIVYTFDLKNPYNESTYNDIPLVIAIGNNKIREEISHKIKHHMGTLVHPSAQIGEDVIIGVGTVILANAVIQSGATIGRNCIINANTTIDHDAHIEDCVNIYPGAYIGGGSVITKLKVIEPNQVIYRNSIF